MATRIFCDHCGNTITKPNVFSFGPLRLALNEAYMSAHRINMQVGVQALTPSESTKIEDVDLCNTCVPIWMSRVKNLTKASDPE